MIAHKPDRTRTTRENRVVGYIRMSTDDQKDSPEQQRHEIQLLAAQHGMRVSEWYEDHGITGNSLEERPAFCRLLKDAESGKFTTILCWDQDRFSRADMIDVGRIIAPLREAGVTLITKAQGIINWSDFSGQIAYLVTQNAKNQFLFDLSRNSLRGRVNKSRKGFWQGNPPYGYDRVYYDAQGRLVARIPWGENFRAPVHWNCKLVPTEDASRISVVQFIFERFANTAMTVGALRTELNKLGIKSPGGGSWLRCNILRILSNVAYIGHTQFGKKRCGKYHRLNDDGDVIRGERTSNFKQQGAVLVKNTHEPLVDADTFQRCQEKYVTVPRQYARYLSPYSLSRILKCGHCGGFLHGESGRHGRRYMCTNASQAKTCICYRLHAEPIERFLAAWLQRFLISDDILKELETDIRARLKGTTETVAISRLRRQMARLEENIQRGRENILLADAKHIAGLQATLDAWQKQKRECEEQLSVLESSSEMMSETNQRLQNILVRARELHDALRSKDILKLKAAFASTLETVTVYVEPRKQGTRTFYSLGSGEIRLNPESAVLHELFEVIAASELKGVVGKLSPRTKALTSTRTRMPAIWARPIRISSR